jgi:hypothetical protein
MKRAAAKKFPHRLNTNNWKPRITEMKNFQRQVAKTPSRKVFLPCVSAPLRLCVK